MKTYSVYLLIFLQCVATIGKAQIVVKATLSLVINTVPSIDDPQETYQEEAILIELKNISEQPLIIFHNKLVQDHVSISIDSIDKNIFISKQVKSKRGSRPNFNGLYQKLIDTNAGNRQLFKEIPISALKDLGIMIGDTLENGIAYGLILYPQQTFRDLKYFRKELGLPGNYLYKYSPLQVESKSKPKPLTFILDGKSYRVVLASEIVSNEFKLTTFKD
ncbi:hypothetical protein [Spirosoma koreense]